MNAAEARECLAAYLSGTRHVSREELAQAHALLASEAAAPLRRLSAALYEADEFVGECALFCSRAAEFCHLTAAQRAAEMPGLVRHLEHCTTCQHIYREVQSVWRPGDGLLKVLSEGVRLVLGAAGNLIERGLGTPAVEEDFVAITAADPSGPRRRVWRFEDVERACAIRMEVCRTENGAEVRCALEGSAGGQIEIFDGARRLFFTGSISGTLSSPIRVVAGLWTLCVRTADASGAAWEIPLDIRMEEDAPPPDRLGEPSTIPASTVLPAVAPVLPVKGRYVGAVFADRYAIERLLAVGGIAEVYIARDRKVLDRRVVVKVLSDRSHHDEYLRRKFQQEVKALERVDDEGVVALLDTDQTPDGRLFLVMKYIQGVTLRDVLREIEPGTMPVARVADLVRQIGNALQAVHGAKPRAIVHRDLKPSNIMLVTTSAGEERVRLIDFGIASVHDAPEGVTGGTLTEQSAGTILYMAPEQFRRQPCVASDIYAMGVIAYEMLTGQRPFPGRTPAELIDMQNQGVSQSPAELRRELSFAVDAAILRALQRDPADRFGSAREFGEALAAALVPPVQAAPAPEVAAIAAAAPVPAPRDDILAHELTVSCQLDKNGRVTFDYRLGRIGPRRPPTVSRQNDLQVIRERIEQVRREVDELNILAMLNKRRERDQFAEAAHRLALGIFPETGFGPILGPELQPQFDIKEADPLATAIPWEALEERYAWCETCRARRGAGANHCSQCGSALLPRVDHLALTYHLSHLASGTGRPCGTGRDFLVIIDPRGDLCDERNDRSGKCEQHLATLQQLIEERGFKFRPLRGPTATVAQVLAAISDPNVAGIYYFGHGFVNRDSAEGCLALADDVLAAHRVVEAAPLAELVFINACESAFAPRGEEAGTQPLSVAAAFAQGRSDRVVIAPIWPIVNVQAAEFAEEFFRQAAQGGACGQAIRHAREWSRARYLGGDPNIAYAAYRFFGDPNRPWRDQRTSVQPSAEPHTPTPPQNEPRPSQPPVPPPPSAGRVFDASGRLQRDVFAFEIDGVLLRAAKRRNRHGRARASITDFLAGLLRVGELTRFVIRQAGLDPDSLYAEVGQRPEDSPETPAAIAPEDFDATRLDEMALRELIERWVIRSRDEFAPDLAARLETAGQAEEGPIAEQAVLEALLDAPAWSALGAGVPAPARVREILANRDRTREVDENGAVPLGDVTPAVGEIIRDAHQLARQCGASEITHRVLMAALIGGPEGFGARVCRAGGVDAKLLWAFLVAVSHETSAAESALGLTPAACARIVTPTLVRARELARDPHAVTEEEFFHAFCEKADPAFAAFLSAPASDEELEPIEASLAEFKTIDLERPDTFTGLTWRARQVVRRAHQLARQRRVVPIPNRLTLAAFLLHEHAFAFRLFRRRSLPVEHLCEVLVASASGNAPGDLPLDEAACSRVIAPMIARARQLAGRGGFITERLLFRAFCEVAEVRMKAELKTAGIDLDLLGTCDPEDPPPPPPPPPSAGHGGPKAPAPPRSPPGPSIFGVN